MLAHWNLNWIEVSENCGLVCEQYCQSLHLEHQHFLLEGLLLPTPSPGARLRELVAESPVVSPSYPLIPLWFLVLVPSPSGIQSALFDPGSSLPFT